MNRKILIAFIVFFSIFNISCTGVFFQPSGKIYFDPVNFKQSYEVVKFKSYDETELTGMFFPAKGEARATVIHFHGNAQNMTSHFLYSSWFVEYGVNVFIFDYRGYGASKGKPGLSEVIGDCKSAIDFIINKKSLDRTKIIVFGQSLGGALAIAALSELKGFQPALVILEGVFSSYKGAASKALRKNFFTFPFFWLAHIAVSDEYKPARLISKINSPMVFLHSPKDKAVPFNEGEKLYGFALFPKEFWKIPDGHIEAFGAFGNVYREKIIEKINEILERV